MLTGLAVGQRAANGTRGAGWIEHLAEAALGQTRLSESARRTPRYRRHLDGDKSLASQLEPYPDENEKEITKARQQREKAALQHALGAARINLRASELLQYTHSVLVEWCHDICETRGALVPSTGRTTELAWWLARNVSAIAADQGAAVCYTEIQQIIIDIERVINRPLPLLPLGACPTEGADGKRCGFALAGRRGAAEVACRRCHTAHNVEELLARLVEQADDYLYTLNELVDWALPAVREYVPIRTLQHWCAKGKLIPRGHGLDGEPRYLLDDVRKLRALKPQTAPTGSSAKRRAG